MSNEDFGRLDPIIDKYVHTKGSLITVLQQAQDMFGYLPMELIGYIAKKTSVKPAKVLGVATFYTQFRLKPVGKNIILLCQGTACHVNSSKVIEDAICDFLHIRDGETTEDGMFTLNNVACLGCCSLSPVMMINGQTYGGLTAEKAKQILQNIMQAQN